MEKYGREFVKVGCSRTPKDDEFNETADGLVRLKKWLVDVRCEGCRGLYYRSKPHVIVPDADWPRNGDVVIGSEIQDIPGKSITVIVFDINWHLHLYVYRKFSVLLL